MSNDNVNHPSHYDGAGIECIDAIEVAFGLKWSVVIDLGNVFKYNYRHREKNGLEDLNKAEWYLNRARGRLRLMQDDDYDYDSLMEKSEDLKRITRNNIAKWVKEHGETGKEEKMQV